MFVKYKQKSATGIEAYKSPSTFTLEGVDFAEGDYIVKSATGALSGVKAADLEAEYEPAKKVWSRKKKAEGEVEVAAEATA